MFLWIFRFDILVNGGGAVTLQFQRNPFHPIKRTVFVPWNDIVVMPNPIVMSSSPSPAPSTSISSFDHDIDHLSFGDPFNTGMKRMEWKLNQEKFNEWEENLFDMFFYAVFCIINFRCFCFTIFVLIFGFNFLSFVLWILFLVVWFSTFECPFCCFVFLFCQVFVGFFCANLRCVSFWCLSSCNWCAFGHESF